MRYKLGYVGSVAASPLGFLFRVMDLLWALRHLAILFFFAALHMALAHHASAPLAAADLPDVLLVLLVLLIDIGLLVASVPCQ